MPVPVAGSISDLRCEYQRRPEDLLGYREALKKKIELKKKKDLLAFPPIKKRHKIIEVVQRVEIRAKSNSEVN